jgi:hypothetical protein
VEFAAALHHILADLMQPRISSLASFLVFLIYSIENNILHYWHGAC